MTPDEVYPVLRDCWMTGTTALGQAPEAWRDVLGADPATAERRLLALAGQVYEVALRPVPAADADVRPDLPPLDLPVMPESARALFRTLPPAWVAPALRLADARGYRAHPLDWFPGAAGDVPRVYRPWQDWLTGKTTTDAPAGPSRRRTPPADLLADLAGFFKPGTTGLLRRTFAVTLTPTKTAAQRARRTDLLRIATLAELAQALGTTPDELIAGADFDEPVNAEFAGMVIRSGTPDQADRLAARLVARGSLSAMRLMPGATRPTQRAALERILAAKDGGWGLDHLTGLTPDLATPADITSSRALAQVLAHLDDIRRDVPPLAYACTAPAAQAVLDRLIAAGVRPHDPALTPLRYNLAIPKET